MENVCIEEALDSLNIHWESRKNIRKEEQERAVKELISGNDVSRLHDFEILQFVTYSVCTFAVLCWVTRLICRFTHVYEGHLMKCFKEEFKEE